MQQLPNNWYFCVLTIKIYIDMGELKDLLSNGLSELEPGEQIQKRFKDIADMLLKKYQIKKGDIYYDILEIEFYFYSKNHPDIITYPRTAPAGYWYFHSSGVDIAFESESGFVEGPKSKCPEPNYAKDSESFGGILIRSIKNRINGDVIKGPLNCVDELFDKFDAFGNLNNFPSLVLRESTYQVEGGMKKCIRYIPPKDGSYIGKFKTFNGRYGNKYDENKSKDFLKCEYCYYIDNEGLYKHYSANPKNREVK